MLTGRNLTLSNVPRNSSKEDLAGVYRIFVVSGWKLATPCEGGFINCWYIKARSESTALMKD